MKCKNYDDTDEVCKDCNSNGVENQQSCFSAGGDKIHPDHYKLDGGREVIDVIKIMLTEEELRGFCKGNYLKYMLRAGKKSGESADDDRKKAAWYFRYLEQLDGFKYLEHAEKVGDVGNFGNVGKFEIR